MTAVDEDILQELRDATGGMFDATSARVIDISNIGAQIRVERGTWGCMFTVHAYFSKDHLGDKFARENWMRVVADQAEQRFVRAGMQDFCARIGWSPKR